MTHPVRCNRAKCRKRQSLKHPIEWYVREPRCECGGKLHRDTWRRKADKARTCYCGGVPFPHNQHHIDCLNYKGQRDKAHEETLKELGATPVTDYDTGEAPW